MSDMNVEQLLAQMRTLSISAGGQSQPTSGAEASDFSSLLKQSIDTVNQHQQTAQTMMTDFETGESDASLAEVMVATQKANLSFQAMVQVRNKLVDAYKEIMNMPM